MAKLIQKKLKSPPDVATTVQPDNLSMSIASSVMVAENLLLQRDLYLQAAINYYLYSGTDLRDSTSTQKILHSLLSYPEKSSSDEIPVSQSLVDEYIDGLIQASQN